MLLTNQFYSAGQDKREERLRRMESQYRALMENIEEIVVRFDRDMRCMSMNSIFEQITGISRKQFCGKTIRETDLPERAMKLWEKAGRQAADKGRKISLEFELTGRYEQRYFRGSIIPEFDLSGRAESLLLIARDITEEKQIRHNPSYRSFHDPITGLYNRAYFEEQVKRLNTRRSLPISFIIGDVNLLKLTNDAFGHAEGDRLLGAIAEILRKCCRKEDIIARWGGDEFAVILPGTDAATTGKICRRIHATARQYKNLLICPSIALGTAVKQHPDENIDPVISAAEQRMYDDKLDRSRKDQEAIIGTLLERLRQKNPGYDEHLVRIRKFARPFAGTLGLSTREFDILHTLTRLHDIGKAAIPEEYLQRPGPLKADEWQTIKRYPETGFHITKTFAETAKVAEEILCLREHWDGNGYPRGLKGRKIPLISRCFSILDSYDTMTHQRPYAPVLTHEQAIAELQDKAGKQFDPELVRAFVKTFDFSVLSRGSRASEPKMHTASDSITYDYPGETI